MVSMFLKEITSIFGDRFEDNTLLQTAFNQNSNQSLAEIGDCVLNLTVKELAFYWPSSTPESIFRAQQKYANKARNQEYLYRDVEFTEYLVSKGCTSFVGNFGLNKADTFVEAIIGAVFFYEGYETAKAFAIKILDLRIK